MAAPFGKTPGKIVAARKERIGSLAKKIAAVQKVPGPSEEEIQIQLMRLVELHQVRCPDLRWLHAVPNGGQRSGSEAGRMKAAGVKPGVPDLDLPIASRGYHSLRLEMKKPGGRVSPDQVIWIAGLRELGHCVQVCWSLDAAWAVICWYLAPKWPLMREVACLAREPVRLEVGHCVVVQSSPGSNFDRIWFEATTPHEARDFAAFYGDR